MTPTVAQSAQCSKPQPNPKLSPFFDDPGQVLLPSAEFRVTVEGEPGCPWHNGPASRAAAAGDLNVTGRKAVITKRSKSGRSTYMVNSISGCRSRGIEGNK